VQALIGKLELQIFSLNICFVLTYGGIGDGGDRWK
jgi:hypothetical protein